MRRAILIAGLLPLASPPAIAWPWSSSVSKCPSGECATSGTTTPAKPKEDEELRARAEALVPVVQAAQADRLRKFYFDWNEDRKTFSIRFERYGDFLATYLDRGGKKTVEAINLGPDSAPKIELLRGHEPDANESRLFRAQKCTVDDGKTWSNYVSFPDVVLPDDDKSDVKSGTCILGDERQLDVAVDDIAREAEDDRIVFGQGGRSAEYSSGWASSFAGSEVCYGAGSNCYINGTPNNMTYTVAPIAPVSGATIRVPAGLGDEVYGRILSALAGGAK
jgi:hypothetical protein